MENIKRDWDLLSEEKRKSSIEKIIEFFKKERSEEIGIIAAEDILNLLLETIGPELYNKGVEDSVDIVKSRMEDLGLDMEVLLKK